jgi:glyoxylase-like metal-dependent hydrolase (beta-lactamase superfamily II)
MINVVRFVNSRFTSNTYIIYSAESEEVWVVDPGDFTPLVAWINANEKTNVKGVLITHVHFDHIYGINELYSMFPSTIFYVYNDEGVKALYDMKKNGSKFTENPIVLDGKASVKTVTPDLELWFGCSIRCFFTPGHSEDSMCMLLGKILFTGDTLIKNHRTVTKIKGGSVEKLHNSIDWIATLRGKGLIIYGGHENSFALDSYDLSIATTNNVLNK